MPPKDDQAQAQPPPPPGAGSEATGGTRHKDTKTGTAPGMPGGAGGAGGAQGGAGNTGRQKDTKAPPQFGTPPPQILQLTPELFQQTVAAAVTAALEASRQQPQS